MRQNKYCKCGHNKTEHDNFGYVIGIKYRKRSSCNHKENYMQLDKTNHDIVNPIKIKCSCNIFLDRNFPQWHHKLFMIISWISLGLLIFTIGSLYYIVNIGLSCHTSICDQELDKPIYSIREIGELIEPILLTVLTLLGISLIPFRYFTDKKRITKPIQEDNKNES